MTMTDKEFTEVETQIREARLRADQEKTQMMQNQIFDQANGKSTIAEQLDMGEELDRIDNLLRGFVLEKNESTGETNWVKPTENKDTIVLSDYGVHLIRNTIAWYLNKNTLLSNYDEATINRKMKDFAMDLNDTIFMEYEKVFQYPSLEDCKKVLNERLKNKKEVKLYSLELLGKTVTKDEEEKIQKEILAEVEPIIEKELLKIKEQIIKDKLKRYWLLLRVVQDAVHSTYLRAWKGQERTTLRQHINITETRGSIIAPPNNPSAPSPLSFLRRKR